MRALIPASYYHDPDVYADEQRAIFSDAWQFAGFAHDLARPDDFVVATVGGRSVVVQNFDGELRGFANVCSHRFSRIHDCAKGNGALRCPYHGWIYNKDGIPYSIPSRPKFDDLTRPVIESLALERFDVDRCVGIVFVRRQCDGPSLRDSLGASYATVEAMTGSLGDPIDENELKIEANWKVTVENTLESYHVGFVHANSFKKVGASGMDFRFEADHSSWLAPVDPTIQGQMQKLLRFFGERAFPIEGYFHQLVFPNVTLATTYGTSFAIQVFQPLGPTRTRFVSHVFQAPLDPTAKRNDAVQSMLKQSVAEFNRTVFDEDKAICEQVQRGVAETRQPGMLSYEEARVLQFQAVYARRMGLAPATAATPPVPRGARGTVAPTA